MEQPHSEYEWRSESPSYKWEIGKPSKGRSVVFYASLCLFSEKDESTHAGIVEKNKRKTFKNLIKLNQQ